MGPMGLLVLALAVFLMLLMLWGKRFLTIGPFADPCLFPLPAVRGCCAEKCCLIVVIWF